MTDDRSPEKRSENMARIKSRGNKATELRLEELMLQANMTGWEKHAKMAGNPDFVFEDERVVVFVDGCFWHGCPKCYRLPNSNVAYWSEKIAKNRRRDKRVSQKLRQEGWSVLRVWSHSLKENSERQIRRIQRKLLERSK